MEIAAVACTAEGQPRTTILEEAGPAVPVLLKSASTDQPLANVEVELVDPVLCEQAPCPPVVVWRGTTDRRGIAPIPRARIHSGTRIRTVGFDVREATASSWYVDNRAWTLKLVPVGTILCGGPDDAWNVRVAGDWRSVEIREHDRAVEFGVLTCSRESEGVPSCGSPDVADAGYIARFSRAAGPLRVEIGAQSKSGARTIVTLACRETR
jgi:hypothetical protein